jgi:hypothetical protein
VKALVEQVAQKKRDQAGDVSSDVAAIPAYPIKDLPEPTASIQIVVSGIRPGHAKLAP